MEDQEIVPFEQLHVNGSKLTYRSGAQRFTGRAGTFYPDGTPKSLTAFQDGEMTGTQKVWFPSGQLHWESNMLEGRPHGRKRIWHESGRLARETEYVAGAVLWEKEWDEQGAQTKDYAMPERMRTLLPQRHR